METTSGGTAETGQSVTTQLALLVPSFDPAKDDLLIYQQKVELLTATWPEGQTHRVGDTFGVEHDGYCLSEVAAESVSDFGEQQEWHSQNHRTLRWGLGPNTS